MCYYQKMYLLIAQIQQLLYCTYFEITSNFDIFFLFYIPLPYFIYLIRHLSKGSFFCSHALTILPKSSGAFFSGLPNFTPLAFAAAIPSACRFLMFSRSLCATKDKICNTRSAIKVPSRFFRSEYPTAAYPAHTRKAFQDDTVLRTLCKAPQVR